MKRVRYPFIVRYTTQANGQVSFARELPNGHFERTRDQLLATVYTDLRMFRKFYRKSPTTFLRDFDHDLYRWNEVDLIYVGL